MTDKEWLGMVRLLKSNFRAKDFIPNKETSDDWFNYFNQYSTEDVKLGVTNYIRSEKYAPTIHELSTYCDEAKSTRRTIEKASTQKEKYVKCLNCLDEGYTLKKYPNGSEELIPCDCAAGHDKYGWLLMTRKERMDYMMDEARRGLKPCFNPWTCDEKFKRSYYSGTR